MVGKAVGHQSHIFQLRWEAAKRFNQSGIAVDFDVQLRHDAVVRRAVLVEVFVFLCHFLQCITDVEGVVLFLGIQHQREVVAFLGNIHHLLVLQFVIILQLGLRLGNLLVIIAQFPPQIG